MIHHPLWSCSIYQNAEFCVAIHFSYIAQPGGGVGIPTVTDSQSLTVRSSSMFSKKIMESSEDFFNCRDCSKARGMFQGSDKV